MKSVYLAGPEVFWPNAVAMGEAKLRLCCCYGLEGLYPLDNEVQSGDRESLASQIYRGNRQMLDACDLVIANISPFRGPSADVGVAFEMGYAAALGKPVWAYRCDDREYHERVPKGPGATDTDGLHIENFGLADNLMLIEAIRASGGQLFSEKAGPSERYDLDWQMKLFERVLKVIAGEG